jgi:hypothetical protein
MEGVEDAATPALRGITLNVFDFVFDQIHDTAGSEREYLVYISYLEIYNEEIKDLLSQDAPKLQLKEGADKGVFVKDLKKVGCCMPWLHIVGCQTTACLLSFPTNSPDTRVILGVRSGQKWLRPARSPGQSKAFICCIFFLDMAPYTRTHLWMSCLPLPCSLCLPGRFHRCPVRYIASTTEVCAQNVI